RDNGLGITLYRGKQKGVATTSDLSRAELKKSIDAALNIAKYTQADECSGLPDKALMAVDEKMLDLDYPMHLDVEALTRVAQQCEQSGVEFDQSINNSDGASINSHRNLRYYANSHGFSAAVVSTRHSLSCVLLAESEGNKQRDHWYTIARDSDELESATLVGEKAASRTIARLNARPIKTQKAKVMFQADVAKTLLGHFISAVSGTSLYRKSSFLLNSLESQIFPDFVTMQEKPWLKKGFASSWFDNEGIATREQNLVENGILKSYLLGSYSARKLNMQPTGHGGGVHNLILNHQGLDFDQMLATMGSGLLVTELMGQGVNMITGDYSRGASGFWVEQGEIQHFVQEITIAGNLKEMYANLIAIGNDYDGRSSLNTGSWLINEMTIAAN
ncbi:MAG: metalloprotease PmbA, partial [Enterobacterales bacterium]|nr:metalloprotease PmbA [Enterobacterales bacterium]